MLKWKFIKCNVHGPSNTSLRRHDLMYNLNDYLVIKHTGKTYLKRLVMYLQ